MSIVEDLKQLNIKEFKENEPMSLHTTYKVGGNAKCFIEVFDQEELVTIIRYCIQNSIKYMVIGKGSDLLFSDAYYDGFILSLNKYFDHYVVSENDVICDAGISCITLAYKTAELGLSGLEFASGIPGTIGGGIYMNAGAYKSCYQDILEYADILVENGEVRRFYKDDLHFAYRTSILQNHPNWIVLSAKLNLVPQDKDEILNKIQTRKERRQSSQPLDKPSAGSVFRNPENIPAWKLIDECGLRGYQIGGARVSDKHSNFIVNEGNATGQDVLDLITYVQKTVLNNKKIYLSREVILVNWE